MGFNSFIKSLVPRDKKFLPLFEKASENLLQTSHILNTAMEIADQTDRNMYLRKIDALENLGDKITHEIYVNLSTSFITPFDREDIHELAKSIDDILDYIHGASKRIQLYNLTQVTQEMSQLSVIILDAVKELNTAIKEMRAAIDIKKISNVIINIRHLERQADHIYNSGVAKLFQNPTDPIEVIKIKEILSSLENATDKCEDAANMVDSVIIKIN